MSRNLELRQLTNNDHVLARQIYAEAIESQATKLYKAEQIRAWSAIAWLPGVLDRPLSEGKGWLSIECGEAKAFAVRYPKDRLALLYTRGCSARRGHGSYLLNQIEKEACNEGLYCLKTEASLLSYSLLLKRGWKKKRIEYIKLNGVGFQRYLMEKSLLQLSK